MQALDGQTKKIILGFQKNEITEHYIYLALSGMEKSEHNSEILKKISDEELRHHDIWQKYSGENVKPNNIKRWFYLSISAVFGITFGIKMMEAGESGAQVSYQKISKIIPEAAEIQKQEAGHENELISMIDEKRLDYLGSMVLGLNDALIEFTGALAGFTLAMQKSRLIAMAGLIMGVSASLSMAASEYFSTKTEAEHKNPLKASFYTGIVYVLTVTVLVFPYFLFSNVYLSLLVMLGLAVLLILIFTFYFSVVREIPFKEHFLEMFFVSIGVAALSFVIGLVVRKTMHIEI